MSYDASDRKTGDRRAALKVLGMGALTALAGSALAGGARAQGSAQGSAQQSARLGAVAGAQNSATRWIGALPASTPITELGLSAQAAARLSPAARNLTKSDLVGLIEGRNTPADARLGVADVNSISAAFQDHPRLMAQKSHSSDHSNSCCCCSLACSCCAAAEHHSLVA